MPAAYRGAEAPDYLPLRRTAYHEAGHAVIDVLLDIHFTWVVARRRQGWVNSSNPCVGWRRGDGPKAELAKRWALSCYAGAAAEEALGEGVEESYLEWDSAEHWLEQFATPRGAAFVGDETHRRQIERLKVKARHLVRGHFQAVERVAAALLKLQALSLEEVISIMNGGPPPRS